MLNGKTVLVTGGAGFIGSAVVRRLLREPDCTVVNLDKLTYAGWRETLVDVETHPGYFFEQADVVDGPVVERIIRQYQPDVIMHLAAESHVDRSIDSPSEFIQTNIIGTSVMLNAALSYWQGLVGAKRAGFLFHHISTDEVYGDLSVDEQAFTEQTPYAPSSPYSASKASADHLVRAWGRTFDLPVIVTNSSNNYGPYQLPEKLIPLVLSNALNGKRLPVYGDGQQVRDWLYVDDHADGLLKVIGQGKPGQSYNIGGNNQMTNLAVVKHICTLLDELKSKRGSYSDLIEFVNDRPGHDRRYAVDIGKMQTELQWLPRHDFVSGLRETVQWYLHNQAWCRLVTGNTHAI